MGFVFGGAGRRVGSRSRSPKGQGVCVVLDPNAPLTGAFGRGTTLLLSALPPLGAHEEGAGAASLRHETRVNPQETLSISRAGIFAGIVYLAPHEAN